MWREIKEKQEMMTRRYVNTMRHTVQVDFIQFMDELAQLCGCKPNLCTFITISVLFFVAYAFYFRSVVFNLSVTFAFLHLYSILESFSKSGEFFELRRELLYIWGSFNKYGELFWLRSDLLYMWRSFNKYGEFFSAEEEAIICMRVIQQI